jgi:hypothetical protein
MKTKYPNLFGILAALMLVVSFVLPASMASPTSVAADPGICKWDTLPEPGAIFGTFVVGGYNGLGTEIIDYAAGNDSNSVAFIVRFDTSYAAVWGAGAVNVLLTSASKGLFPTLGAYTALARASGFGGKGARNLFQIVMAPDNPKFMAITSDNGTLGTGPTEVWVTENGGAKWEMTNLDLFLKANGPIVGETVRCIDISPDYGGVRDIAVGTATGAGTGRLIVAKSTGFAGWKQNWTGADFFALKFSPSYASDGALASVHAFSAIVGGGTRYNIFLRDLDKNEVNSLAFSTGATYGIEVTTCGVAGSSADCTQLNKADLELPSDFSGQAASLRRAYISTDTLYDQGAAADWFHQACDGIVRIDNTTLYVLMDTTNDPTKAIYSIAYFGTYASGKLLAGDRLGYPCEAAVPTYFTDSPTTCPVPCWYDAAKPTTGAACQAFTNGGLTPGVKVGTGAANVNWFINGQLALAATSSDATDNGTTWWAGLLGGPTFYDEGAYGISRNNGETWNQVALIDSIINKMTDIAPSADCKTIYLATVNLADLELPETCGFDSVWRTSQNPDVTSPLTPLPVGSYWERVWTHVTAPDCRFDQTNVGLLRVVPYCADPTGEIVAWGVYDHAMNLGYTHGVAYWSPDFGDYWAPITVRNPIQDFCFESRNILYFLSPDGLVQQMPYTGTSWSSAKPDVLSYASSAHTIAAFPEGKVLVGWAGATVTAVSYSSNFNTETPSMATLTLNAGPTRGGSMHVAFDPNFNDTSIFFMAEESTGHGGSVYRNNPGSLKRWSDMDMMAVTNGAVFCPDTADLTNGFTGIFLGFTGQALYVSSGMDVDGDGGVWRTIDDGTGKYGPLSGLPKPGIAWDRLYIGLPDGIEFTLQPTALKGCGCCTLDTDTTLYAIDDNVYAGPTGSSGKIWGFTDCLAKRGPALITEDATLIGCDPVSGRAQEVNLCWEQLCVADAYDIEISKTPEFNILVIDWVSEASCGGLVPTDVTSPCVFFPAGGLAAGGSQTIVIITGGGGGGGGGVGGGGGGGGGEAFVTVDQAFGPTGSAIALAGNLECGHTYYWRVKARRCATTQIIRSPWSEARSFTVKAGLPTVSPYLGLQLLSPNNGCLGCPVSPASFSWSPFKDTTKYKFVLAKDSEMTQIVKEAEVSTTAYEYDGTLDYSTNYFWRVMSEEPAPSDWSATFSFQTEAQPAAAQGPAPAAPTPIWVWVVIAIGAILVIVTLVLIFKTRRV